MYAFQRSRPGASSKRSTIVRFVSSDGRSSLVTLHNSPGFGGSRIAILSCNWMTFKPSWKGVWLFESQDEASRLPPDRRWDILRRARRHVEGVARVVCLEAWSQGAEVVSGL